MITLRSSLKSETSTSKKTIRDMEASLTECTARTQKAEREYTVLRDSIKGLVESFQTDAVNLREEMKRREDKLKSEAEEMGRKYRLLLEEIQKEREDGGEGIGELRRLTRENERIGKEIEDGLRTEMRQLRAEVDRSTTESEEATQTAKWVPSTHPVVFRWLTGFAFAEILPPSSVVYAGSCDKRVPLQRRTPVVDLHDRPLVPLPFVSYIASYMLFIGLVALLSNFIPRTQDPDTPISRTPRPNHTLYCISLYRHWTLPPVTYGIRRDTIIYAQTHPGHDAVLSLSPRSDTHPHHLARRPWRMFLGHIIRLECS